MGCIDSPLLIKNVTLGLDEILFRAFKIKTILLLTV
jgi:hypothetical protein